MLGHPPCFLNRERYRLWAEAFYQSGVRASAAEAYCMDCTPEYKSLAQSHGLCTHPETVFIRVLNDDGEEEVIGVREWWKGRPGDTVRDQQLPDAR